MTTHQLNLANKRAEIVRRMYLPLETNLPELSTRHRRDKLTESIHAIICLYETGELTEGQAVKLMNSGDRVSFRLTREVVLREMKGALAADMAAHGWKWTS